MIGLRWLLFTTLVFFTLCLHAQVEDDPVQAEIEQMQLRTRLYNFAEDYGVLMQETIDSLRGENIDSDTWLGLIGWSYRSVVYFRRAPYTINPHVALADNLVLIMRINHYLRTDEAAETFGQAHGELQKAMSQASVLIWKLAAQEMDPDELEAVYVEVEQWAVDHPLDSYLSYQYPVALAADDKLISKLEDAAPDFFLGNLDATAGAALNEVKILQLQLARLSDFVEQSPIYGSWLGEFLMVADMKQASIADAVDAVASIDDLLDEVQDAAGRIDTILTDMENPEEIAQTMGATFIEQLEVMIIRVMLVFFALMLLYRLLTNRLVQRTKIESEDTA